MRLRVTVIRRIIPWLKGVVKKDFKHYLVHVSVLSIIRKDDLIKKIKEVN